MKRITRSKWYAKDRFSTPIIVSTFRLSVHHRPMSRQHNRRDIGVIGRGVEQDPWSTKVKQITNPIRYKEGIKERWVKKITDRTSKGISAGKRYFNRWEGWDSWSFCYKNHCSSTLWRVWWDLLCIEQTPVTLSTNVSCCHQTDTNGPLPRHHHR